MFSAGSVGRSDSNNAVYKEQLEGIHKYLLPLLIETGFSQDMGTK